MTLLKPLGAGQGYLKAGFLGFTAAGKTTTAMFLAIAARRHFKLDGPIAMFDTEGGSEFVAPWVKAMSGKDLLGVRARSFSDLMETGKECVTAGVSVLVVDSIAHPWDELKQSFLDDLNASRRKKGWSDRNLEFQDWGKIKPMWEKWTSLYLNSPLHIIVCGRAGDIYEKEKNEETGRSELSKTGVKMQTEKNFGYEPSLLVEMSREQILEPTVHFVRRANVWKDRFGVIDAATCDFVGGDIKDPQKREKELEAVWAFFGQHVKLLTPGATATVDVDTKTATGADEVGDDGWSREKRDRTILAEEIQGEIVAAIPGMSADEKKQKAHVLFEVFGTRSWTAVENMPSFKLREGLAIIRKRFSPKDALVLTPEPSLEDEARARELAEAAAHS